MTTWVRSLLEQFGDRTALRVAPSPGAQALREYSGAELLELAGKLAATQQLPDERRVVLLLLPHCPELFLLHFGLILAGHIPAILAWPTTRVDPEKYQRNLLHQLRRIPAQRLITLPRLAQNLSTGLPYEVTGCDTANAAHFETVFRNRFAAEPTAAPAPGASRLPEDVLFLQFSGGTTGAQKCVPVTQTLLRAQLERLGTRLSLTPGDGVVSWLPLYHDMGLIACLWLPLSCGAASLHFAAADWLLRPELLLEYIDGCAASFTWLPNFAFAYLAQRRGAMSRRYDLRRMRAWINCSEPVRRSSMLEFARAFADLGVSGEQLQASYAMAENVFAVTQTDLQSPLRTIARTAVRHSALALRPQAHEVLDALYVSSGRCLPETEVRLKREDGALCAEREAGEVQIRSPSLFLGYWGEGGLDTRSFDADGWHSTGDLGFTDQGELFLIGRLKDVIIVGGQNVFPEDIEAIAGRVPGLRAGRIVAFGVDDAQMGTQSIVVIAEMADAFEAQAAVAIERAIRALLSACLGVSARYVHVLPTPWIIKSTAGKASRNDTRARFLAELRAPVTAAAAS
jgi:fatty-acyl-CoA synthase